jgi:hypothetical protein
MRMGRSKSKLVPENDWPSRRLRGPWTVALLQVMPSVPLADRLRAGITLYLEI